MALSAIDSFQLFFFYFDIAQCDASGLAHRQGKHWLPYSSGMQLHV